MPFSLPGPRFLGGSPTPSAPPRIPDDRIVELSRDLYPTGRAFKIPVNSDLEKMHKGLSVSEGILWNDAISLLFSILPDNDNFFEDDATDWERRLGLITNQSTPLSDRKLAIIAKLNQPGINPAKQNFMYLQEQLNNAGFGAVTVYENIFANYPNGNITKTPEEVSGLNVFKFQNEFNDFQFGQRSFGTCYNNLLANHIEESKDLGYMVGHSLRKTFFLGGNPLGTYANVLASRHDEFRQLILRYKPTQTVAFLFINYV